MSLIDAWTEYRRTRCLPDAFADVVFRYFRAGFIAGAKAAREKAPREVAAAPPVRDSEAVVFLRDELKRMIGQRDRLRQRIAMIYRPLVRELQAIIRDLRSAPPRVVMPVEVAALKEQIETLTGRNNSLEAQVAALRAEESLLCADNIHLKQRLALTGGEAKAPREQAAADTIDLNMLLAKVPVSPAAITWDCGVRLLNELQRLAKAREK